jgi:hypothetical protein
LRSSPLTTILIAYLLSLIIFSCGFINNLPARHLSDLMD